MNILHISTLKAGELATLITTAGESLDSYNITVYSGAEVFGDYDVVVMGINDGGTEVTEEQAVAILTARENGTPIIFTHDCPQRSCFQYESLAPLNLVCYRDGYTYSMYTSIGISNPSHAIFTTPYDLSAGFTVEETHGVDSELPLTWTILAHNPAEVVEDRANHYLAISEEAGKGRMIHWAAGHNRYNSDQFFGLPVDECKLFVNMLQWVIAPLEMFYGNLS